MTILVTGGHGMLGAAIVRQLNQYNTIAPRRADLDLLDRGAVESFVKWLKPEFVYHCAAHVKGLGGNLADPLSGLFVNDQISSNLFHALAVYPPAKVFFAGSVAAYPERFRQDGPFREYELWSGEPHAGEYGYAQSKRHAGVYLELLKQHRGVDYAHGLLTNLYGPEDNFGEGGHVIPSLVHRAYTEGRKTGVLKVWGSGRAERDFLYVEDAARAAILMMSTSGSLVANVVSGRVWTIGYVAKLIAIHAEVGDVQLDETKPEGVLRRSFDVSKLKALGFVPQVSLRQGLELTCLAYEKKFRSSGQETNSPAVRGSGDGNQLVA